MYFQIAKSVFKRVVFEARFRQLKLRAFLSQDDYNTDHVVRSQVLRALGVRSLGVCHGIPTFPVEAPTWRYYDYDDYYMITAYPYEKYFRKTWPKSMRVHAIGPVGVTQAQLRAARD